jgi:hypothetical protein
VVRILKPGVDEVSAKHICAANPQSLRETSILSLERGKVNRGVRLTLQVVAPCLSDISVAALVRVGG